MASSAGLAITWLTAMGPLNFSWGKPLKNPQGYDEQFFQFTLGQTF
jgi:outer membrane protein insertion porin family